MCERTCPNCGSTEHFESYERCDRLLACPATAYEVLRSRTWATVRYARKAGKPITIILPDGSVREE